MRRARAQPEPLDAGEAVEETRAVLEQASRLYERFSCPATAECCHLAVTTRPPWLWPTEWAVLRQALPSSVPPPRPGGGCRLLDAAGLRCTAYDARPFGCRTFFCEKRRGPVNEPTARAHALQDELRSLNVALDPLAAPRPIDEWFELERP